MSAPLVLVSLSGGQSIESFATATQSPDVAISGEAAIEGSLGLEITVNDNEVLAIIDSSPDLEPRYRARFYIDPNSIGMAHKEALTIFQLQSAAPRKSLAWLRLRNWSGSYQLRLIIRDSLRKRLVTPWFVLADRPSSLEIDWLAASADDLSDGHARLWIDAEEVAALTALSTGGQRVDRVRLGVVSRPKTNTRGSLYFDAFESRRRSYIGPVSQSP